MSLERYQSARQLLRLLAALVLLSLLAITIGQQVEETAKHPNHKRAQTRFDGLKALVIEPENFWGWDAAVFGALHERRFDVTYAKPSVLEDYALLSQFDIVASNIRRSFNAAQVENLKRFIADGGAFYGSWGGPMATPDLLKACKVASTRSVRITGMTLLDGPIAQGIDEREIAFPPVIAHSRSERWEMVAVKPIEGGIPVAKDTDGNILGVLGEYGKGRTAVLGFGPEMDKYFANREIGPVMMDNLLIWLLENKLNAPRRWTGIVELSLPARAEVKEVRLNGKPVTNPKMTRFGSLRKIALDLSNVGIGKEVTITVTYKPLTKTQNIETVIHMPWGSFPFFIRNRNGTPEMLAEWLKSINATICQPLLREASGVAYYKGMPEDTTSPEVAGYKGNFLAEFVDECHKRGIKVIGGIYLESPTTLKRYPEAAVVGRDGKVNPKQACFNNPKGQEYNLATIKHLVENYKLDGVILDDNFELQDYDCHCSYCKEDFRRYCERTGTEFRDPSRISWGDPLRLHWVEYKLWATRRLVSNIAEIVHRHNLPLGGWVGVGMRQTHLKEVFDFIGGMVYTTPTRATRLMLWALGDCKFICLLWAPNERPERMEQEFRDAIFSGNSAVGFWIYPPGHIGAEGYGGWRMLEGSYEAIARSFANAEKWWLEFYRQNILTGDPRFAVVDGKMARNSLTLRVKNFGKVVGEKVQGKLDLEAIMPFTVHLSFVGPSGLRDVTEFVSVGKPFDLRLLIQNQRNHHFKNVPFNLELPEDFEIVKGQLKGRVDLPPYSQKELSWILRKEREGRSNIRCFVSAGLEKPDWCEVAVVGKPEMALQVRPEKVEIGSLDSGASGKVKLTIENIGLEPIQNITISFVGEARKWLRVEGLPQSIKAPNWRFVGSPVSRDFVLHFEVPIDAKAGHYNAELVIKADGVEERKVPVSLEVVPIKGLVIAVIRTDNKEWPEATNEHVYEILKDWAKDRGFTLIGIKRGDERLLDQNYLRKIHLLYIGSVRTVPRNDFGGIAKALKDYVEDGGWVVGDSYGFAWGMMDIRPEIRNLVGLKWAYPGSNKVFSDAKAIIVTKKHPLTEGLEIGKEIPHFNASGSIFRFLPNISEGIAIPVILLDSEAKYPYVTIREFGKGRCIMFSAMMGYFIGPYKSHPNSKPAQIIMQNLIKWRAENGW
ncbi:MAG: beta-galactosidase [Armatimonadota bacterium]|nr:beta-galactosidase [Armatimonadota bacterium]MDW8026460.1 beta-galactosidase [Armatimonadota bacterium]